MLRFIAVRKKLPVLVLILSIHNSVSYKSHQILSGIYKKMPLGTEEKLICTTLTILSEQKHKALSDDE